MDIRFSCPTCHKALKVSSDLSGQVHKCPGCRVLVKIPGADELHGAEPVSVPAESDLQTDEHNASGIGVNGDSQFDNSRARALGDPPHGNEPPPVWSRDGFTAERPGEPPPRFHHNDGQPKHAPIVDPEPGPMVGYVSVIPNVFATPQVTQAKFAKILSKQILLGEFFAVTGGFAFFSLITVWAIRAGSAAAFAGGILALIATAALAYVASYFSRAGANWIFESPLPITGRAATRAIGLLYFAAGFGTALVWLLATLASEIPSSPGEPLAIQLMVILPGLASWIYGAWLLFNPSLLGVHEEPPSPGKGSRVLKHFCSLMLLMLRLFLVSGILTFAINTGLGALLGCYSTLLAVLAEQDRSHLWGMVALKYFGVGLGFPTVLYIVYLIGSVVPEFVSLIVQIEANTRGGTAPFVQAPERPSPSVGL